MVGEFQLCYKERGVQLDHNEMGNFFCIYSLKFFKILENFFNIVIFPFWQN